MSSAVVSTSAALGRPFLFDAESEPDVRLGTDKKPAAGQQGLVAKVLQSSIKNQQSAIPYVTPASQLEIRPLPEMVPSGIAEIDALTGGLPRGCLTEICGSASSGRTSVMLAALAAATQRGEYCALIDASDAVDPHSVVAAGVNLDRLLWVRCGEDLKKMLQKTNGCPISHASSAREVGIFDKTTRNPAGKESRACEHRLEQVLRATDLLLESGGFGLIVLDLGDIPSQAARRIPLATWFRFRRAVEHKPTILLAVEQQPIAGSCSSLLLQLGVVNSQLSVLSSGPSRPSHAQLLTGLEINVELIRSRLQRKPTRSVTFAAKTAWAG